MPETCVTTGFRHEARFYEGGLDGFAGEIAPLVSDTLQSGGRAAVAAPTNRIERMAALFGSEERVELIDMTELGVNPARIIPAWRDLADRALEAGGPFLGVGEPIWVGRTPAELDECHRHEALINVAFGADPAWRLVCPYDVDGLDTAVVEDARRTHPTVRGPGRHCTHAAFDGLAAFDALERPLSPVPAGAVTMPFERQDLAAIRTLAAHVATGAGLTAERTQQLLLAVTELTANSIRHGGGVGTLSIWRDDAAVIAQSRDRGRMADPMAGRRRPGLDDASGRGLWIMHQLCDLVQVRTTEHGTVVRITHR
jgi:anti-sigma regulatory factor (Ser/Thr protein kinase)